MNTFDVSFFKNKHDNQPKLNQHTWSQLLDLFKTPNIRGSKDGLLIAPAKFNGKRAKANVEYVSLLMLDVDSGLTIDSAIETLKKTGYESVIHTSFSHSESLNKFRVIIPLDKPIPADQYSRLWHWGSCLFGNTVDQSVNDCSRIFYTPACSQENLGLFRFHHKEGKALDWSNLPLNDTTDDLVALRNKTQPNANHAALGTGSVDSSSHKQRSEYSGGGQSTQPDQKTELKPKPELKVSINYVDDAGLKRDIKKLVTSDCNITDVIAELQANHPNTDPGKIETLVKRQLESLKKATVEENSQQESQPEKENGIDDNVESNAVIREFFSMFRYRLTNNKDGFNECVKDLSKITSDIKSTLTEFEDFYRAKLEKYSQKLVIPDNMVIHESNSRYISLPTAKEGDTMIVKAAMGSGKTYYLENAIKEFRSQGLTVAYIVHRISLAKSAANRLNLDFYQDKPEFTQGASIVVNSIPNFSGFLGTPDVVVIDEIDQVIKHITGSACSNGHEVLKTLKEWVSKAKIVIAMSADIDELTINFITHCRPGKIDFYLNRFKPREGQEIQVCDKGSTLYLELFQLLRNGDKGCVVICTNSKNQSQRIYETLHAQFPKKNGVCINSDNTENEDIQNLIKDIDTHIDQLDYLVFSPSIGSGVSIETPNVRAVFGYFTSQTIGVISKSSSTSQDAWQQIGRVRKLDVPTYVYVDSRLNLDLPIVEDEISQIIMDRVEAECVEIEKADHPDWTKSKIVSRLKKHVFSEHERLWMSVKIAANTLNRDFGNYFLVQGVMAGISFSTVKPPKSDFGKDLIKVGIKRVKKIKEDSIFNARDITDSEFRDLMESSKGDSKLSQDDQAAITKHLIEKEYNVPPMPTDTTDRDYEEKLKKYDEGLKNAIAIDDDGKGRKIIKRIKATLKPVTDVGKDDVFTLNNYLKQGKLVKVYDEKLALLDREMVARLFEVTGVYIEEGYAKYDDKRRWHKDDPSIIEFVAWCKKSGLIPKKYKGSNCQVVGQFLEGLGITTSRLNNGIYKITEGKPGGKGEALSFTLASNVFFGVKKPPHPCPSNIYSVKGEGCGSVEIETMRVERENDVKNTPFSKGDQIAPQVMTSGCDKCYDYEATQKAVTSNDVCYNGESKPALIENHNKPHKVDMPKNLWRGFDSDEEFWYKRTIGLSRDKRIALAHEYNAIWEKVNAENANTMPNPTRRTVNSWLIDATEKRLAEMKAVKGKATEMKVA